MEETLIKAFNCADRLPRRRSICHLGPGEPPPLLPQRPGPSAGPRRPRRCGGEGSAGRRDGTGSQARPEPLPHGGAAAPLPPAQRPRDRGSRPARLPRDAAGGTGPGEQRRAPARGRTPREGYGGAPPALPRPGHARPGRVPASVCSGVFTGRWHGSKGRQAIQGGDQFKSLI